MREIAGSIARRLPLAMQLRLLDIRDRRQQARLRARHPDQIARYRALAPRLAALESDLRRIGTGPFAVPFWERTNERLRAALLPVPPREFLRHPLILESMFMSAGGALLERELRDLESRFDPRELRLLLEEDPVGGPLLQARGYASSHNSVHLLYHIARFVASTGTELSGLRRIVEWGGGYGRLAVLMRRLCGRDVAYAIVDTPLFTAIQWLYLASILGEASVRVARDPHTESVPGVVTLIPVGLVEDITVEADLCVSTWALSESSRYAQEHVRQRAWFGARHLLLGYQVGSSLVPDSSLTGELARKDGATIEPLAYQPGNFYAFR